MIVMRRPIYNRRKMRRVQLQILLVYLVLCWAPSIAQDRPIVVSVASLSQNPRRFDGHLVSVRALLLYGWEGDNFLFDASDLGSGKTPRHNEPRVWFYCKPGSERFVYSGLRNGYPRDQGLFTGYFHFVPNKKGRIKDVFDPGPLQLETISVTDLDSQSAKP
jgi:hypothetical protein